MKSSWGNSLGLGGNQDGCDEREKKIEAGFALQMQPFIESGAELTLNSKTLAF